MGTIESLLGKPLHECTDEELQEFVQARRRDITAIQESDIMLGGGTKKAAKKSTQSAAFKAAVEDAL